MSDLSRPAPLAASAGATRASRAVAALVAVAPDLALPAILAVAALLRAWNIASSGYGTLYYSAGVRSMMAGWHNFLFNAFDPAGFVSVDKPPVALWLQVAASEIVGFGPVGVHLPQVIEGVVSVLLLHRIVARRFGAMAGLLAALFLALTPISVAVDRSNNTDTCLVLALLVAAWAMLRAIERASQAWLIGAMALVGLAFNVKMLAACVVLPAFCGVYLFAAPTSAARRVRHLALSAPVLVAVSLSWVTAFDLVPAGERPYAGSSADNSMLELAVIHNGLQRFVSPRPARPDISADAAPQPARDYQRQPPMRVGGGSRVPAGPLRLLDPSLATQFGWLLPLAIIGCAITVARGWRAARRRPGPLGPGGQMLALFAGWALIYGIVLSAAAGIFHAYYIVTMAPPVAALAGIGAAQLWRSWRAGDRFHAFPPMAFGLTAVWQIWIGVAELIPSEDAIDPLSLGLLVALLGGAGLAAASLLVLTSKHPRAAGAAFACGILALLTLPAAWSVATAARVGAIPDPLARLSAPPGRFGGQGGGPQFAGAVQNGGQNLDTRRLVAFTRANNSGETFLFAAPTTRIAAPIIIAGGEPVMAMGGFSGSDPIVGPDSIAAMVARGDLRFVLFRNGAFGRGAADRARAAALDAWLGAHGEIVDPRLWNAPGPATTYSVRRGLAAPQPAFHLYDLRPDLGVSPVAEVSRRTG